MKNAISRVRSFLIILIILQQSSAVYATLEEQDNSKKRENSSIILSHHAEEESFPPPLEKVSLDSFTSTFLSPGVYESDNMEKILSFPLIDFDDKDLVVFDVDDTLIGGLDPYFHKHFVPNTPLNQRLFQSDENICDKYFYGLMPTRPWTIIEPQTPTLISKLQTKGIKVISLTGLRPIIKEDLGINIPDWRVEHLRTFGYDFSKSFLSTPLLWGWSGPKSQSESEVFKKGDDLKSYFKKGDVREPYFKEGVMFSGSFSKPAALLSFLSTVSFKPRNVLFIDDCADYVDAVYRELTLMNIPCHSILYTRTHKYPTKGMFSSEEFNSYLKKQEDFVEKLLQS